MANKIKLDDFPIFTNHFSSLKKTSLDNRDGHKKYMTESELTAVCFDDVKDEYVELLGMSEIPKSNDALFDEGNGTLVFVEFKSGHIDSQKQFAIRKKIYDSTLIFTDISSTGISYMREQMKYILVYNDAANKNADGRKLPCQRESVQTSEAYDKIAKIFSNYGGREYIGFGLGIFQNYCFKEVHTYTQTEFEEYLSSL